MNIITSENEQFFVYTGIALVVVIGTAVLTARSPAIYAPFFGRFHPVLVMVFVSVLGFFLLALLLARGWFLVFRSPVWPGLAVAALAAAVLALVMIFFDSRVVLPADINRPYPDALLFYPTIAFVVEIIFHVLPLTLILLALTTLFDGLTFERIIWPVIIVVSLLEPVFQTVAGYSRPYPWWVMLFIAAIIFLVNVAELALFRRYDFLAMYTVRLVYYLLWHIIWGVLRLKLLF